jgi:glucokinase
VIGPGTGLGCALLLQQGQQPLIRETFGGHLRPSPATPEQADLIFELQKNHNQAIIYEDLASGKGLKNLYAHFKESPLQDPDILIAHSEDKDHEKILRLFHEFLGLYIQNILISTHCFSETILCGGLLDYLYENNLFDFQTVKKFIDQPYVKIVQTSLKNTPVSYINDTYLALYGLQNYWKRGHAGLSNN